jgi:hypothetical protein
LYFTKQETYSNETYLSIILNKGVEAVKIFSRGIASYIPLMDGFPLRTTPWTAAGTTTPSWP